MSNFVQILGLEKLLEENNIHAPYNDFEALYSDITVDETKQELKEYILYLKEKEVWLQFFLICI